MERIYRQFYEALVLFQVKAVSFIATTEEDDERELRAGALIEALEELSVPGFRQARAKFAKAVDGKDRLPAILSQPSNVAQRAGAADPAPAQQPSDAHVVAADLLDQPAEYGCGDGYVLCRGVCVPGDMC